MKLRGELKIILGAALFALIPVGLKMDPASGLCSLLFGRLLIASVALFFMNRKNRVFLILRPGELVHLIIWAVLMLVAMLFYFYSIKTVGVAISSALLGVQPLVLVLMSIFFVRETITLQTVISCAFILFGIVCISDLTAFGAGATFLGQAAAILSAISLSCIFIYQKKYLRKIGAQKLTFFQCLFQLPFLLPLLFLYPPELSVNYFGASLILGIGCTVLSYGLIYAGVKSVAVQKIGVLQSIEYVIPVFLGLFLYNEQLSSVAIVGAFAIVAACIFIQVSVKRG
ncbi:MAG: DMT family transporter [Crocinitomicaceae bacterium]|nr:DMT family transporter [Flavobacteriales bacterium]NQZ37714.1 DMT family transporter [Crocinitomicaceae bacterium]